jgi:hypothetical protein
VLLRFAQDDTGSVKNFRAPADCFPKSDVRPVLVVGRE